MHAKDYHLVGTLLQELEQLRRARRDCRFALQEKEEPRPIIYATINGEACELSAVLLAPVIEDAYVKIRIQLEELGVCVEEHSS